MQEVLTARLVRYHDGRPDVQVQLHPLGGEWTLIHRLREKGLRLVQFIPFPEATWLRVDGDPNVLFEFSGCVVIESARPPQE